MDEITSRLPQYSRGLNHVSYFQFFFIQASGGCLFLLPRSPTGLQPGIQIWYKPLLRSCDQYRWAGELASQDPAPSVALSGLPCRGNWLCLSSMSELLDRSLMFQGT